jgi:hypothetical protein
MLDPNTALATLGVAIIILGSLTLVLSRIIPDEYDRRAPVRPRIESGISRRVR